MKYNAIVKDGNGYKIGQKEVALPTGKLVVDVAALESAFSNALSVVSMKEAGLKLASIRAKIEKAMDSTTTDAATVTALKEEVASLESALKDFPATADVDGVSILLAFAVTGTRLVKLSDAAAVVETLRNADITKGKEVAAARDTVNNTMNRLFDTRTVDYLKNVKCDLSLDKVRNLIMIAQSEARKWNKKGITAAAAKDSKVFQQVLLTIFETGYNLTVSDAKKQDTFQWTI